MGKKNPFGFKNGNLHRVDKGVRQKRAGYYPSERRFGSQISPTASERLKYDSRWSRWRKGYELFAQGAFWDYGSSVITILPDTADETRIRLRLYGFAPSESDRSEQLHYVLYREPDSYETLGVLTAVEELEDNRSALIVTQASSQLRRLIGDRITDGACSATIVDVRTNSGIPLLLRGSLSSGSLSLRITIERSPEVESFVANAGGVAGLAGNTVFGSPNLFPVLVDSAPLFGDEQAFFLGLNGQPSQKEMIAIEGGGSNFSEFASSIEISGIFSYDGAELSSVFSSGQDLSNIAQQISSIEILSGALSVNSATFDAGQPLVLTASASVGEASLLVNFDGATIFVDPQSSSVTLPDGTVSQISCQFTTGVTLKATPLFCCSCPDHSRIRFRSPGAKNRQDSYPLPSFASKNKFNTFDEVAGLYSTWRKEDYSPRTNYCKHIYAVQFANQIRPQEPGDYPTESSLAAIEASIAKEMKVISRRMMNPFWGRDYARLEVLYVLAQGVGLDSAEFASILGAPQENLGTGSIQIKGQSVQVHNGFSLVDLFENS